MPSEILINSNAREIRVALTENNQLAELFIEHQDQKGIVGNIYKGIVTKVLPGMQVAFVDMGLENFVAKASSAPEVRVRDGWLSLVPPETNILRYLHHLHHQGGG